jgi:hypothetical protein
MPDEHTLALRQADQARADFAALEDELDVIKAQLATVADQEGTGTPHPTRDDKRCSAHDRLGHNLRALSSAAPQTKPPYFRANSLSG